METPVQPGFRVIRGPDWSYKNQDGGKGHAGTVVRLQDVHRPHFPPNSVLVQWDNGDKGLYRAGYDQAYDLRILETANSVCHTKVWCDGCDADEIRGIRWRCTECYAIDLCTTCYMNDEHDLSHVFMRVLSSHKTSMGPKMLPRSSSPHVALRGCFPGAKVVRYPQLYKKLGSDKQLGKVLKSGQTPEDKAKVQAAVKFSPVMPVAERVPFTKIACTLPGSGGYVYDGHLPNLGDLEEVNEGDNVLVIANSAELEKLHKRRGLWDPNMAKTFRTKGFVSKRTHTGDFKVTFDDIQKTFSMNPAALRKLHRFRLGQAVRIHDDIEMVKRLQLGQDTVWTEAMIQTIGKVGKVVGVDGMNIHVQINDYKFTFNSANLTPAIRNCVPPPPPDEARMTEIIEDTMRHYLEDPDENIVHAVVNNDIQAAERILRTHPEWVNYEFTPGKTPLCLCLACDDCTNMLKFLVKKGAFIESYDDEGNTPLIMAASSNNPETVRYLLEEGADVFAANFEGQTSLAVACDGGFFECAHYLLMHGADINQKNKYGVTPLLQSMKSGGRTVVDLIIDHKDTDLKTVLEGQQLQISALHCAIEKGNSYAVAKLVEKIPRLVEAKDFRGCTPIFLAAYSGFLKAVELLIKKGHCKVNVLNEYGYRPLGLAVTAKQFHVVDILIKNGADPNLPSNDSKDTTLQIALDVSKDPEGQHIKEESYMAEMKRKWGHLGIKTNGDALLAYLVSHGADLDRCNRDNITARDMLLADKNSTLQALDAIQSQKGNKSKRKDFARQESTANRPLRNLSKKSPSNENGANSVPSLLKKSNARSGSKKQSSGNPSELVYKSSGSQEKSSVEESRDAEQEIAAGSEEAVSDAGDLNQLLAELRRKDEELDTLRSRVEKLEHLVKKKISFACGHEVIRSIAELIPECPECSEPIASVFELQ